MGCSQTSSTACAGGAHPGPLTHAWTTVAKEAEGRHADYVLVGQHWKVDGRQRIECVICTEEKEACFFGPPLTKKCRHAREVCRDCVEKTVDTELREKGSQGLDKMKCLQPDCEENMTYDEIIREVSEETRSKLDDLTFKATLVKLPAFRWCSKPGCGNGCLVDLLEQCESAEDEMGIYFTCDQCGQGTCAYHRCKRHDGVSCADYDKTVQSSQEAAQEQYLKEVVRCPQCGHGIEKIDGCDHMTCRQQASGCGAEFCIRCLVRYDGPKGIRKVGNKAHKRSCKWYA